MTTAGENAGMHMECMWSNGPNLTIRNSVFRDCAIMDLFLTRGSWYGQAQRLLRHAREQRLLAVRAHNNGGVHFYSVLVHENADSIDRYTVSNNRFDLRSASATTPS